MSRLEYAWGTPSSATTRLRNVGYDACLDVPGSSQTNDVQLQVTGCGSGDNQQWTRQSDGRVTVYNGTKCLTAAGSGTTNGTRVVIDDCQGGAGQQWYRFSDGTIRNAGSKLCLDADLYSEQNVQGWSCGNGDNHKWQAL